MEFSSCSQLTTAYGIIRLFNPALLVSVKNSQGKRKENIGKKSKLNPRPNEGKR
jgi:hypothetical protein